MLVLWWQVKKLVHENRLLRCGYSPVDIPPSVNGREAPKNDGVGCGRPARWSLIESSDSRRHIAVCAFCHTTDFTHLSSSLATELET